MNLVVNDHPGYLLQRPRPRIKPLDRGPQSVLPRGAAGLRVQDLQAVVELGVRHRQVIELDDAREVFGRFVAQSLFGHQELDEMEEDGVGGVTVRQHGRCGRFGRIVSVVTSVRVLGVIVVDRVHVRVGAVLQQGQGQVVDVVEI